MRLGVIGTGIMGTAHLRTLATTVPGAQIVAVCDLDPRRARAAVEQIGQGEVVTDPVAVISTVDAVLVAAPDPTHEELVLACLRQRRPVFCEKPLAHTAPACLRVVEAEAALGHRLVQVGFMRRFDPGYCELKRIVDSGRIGRPLMVHCVHRNRELPPSFTSDMLFTSSAAHEIDAVRWLLGEEIAEVAVHTPPPSAPSGVQDTRIVVFTTESGVVVDVEIFVNARYGYEVRCEVVGETGAAALTPSAPVAVWRDGAAQLAVPEDWRDRFAAAYTNELVAWVDGLRSGRVSGPSAWDGYAARAVAEAGLDAADSGRAVAVNLAPKPALYAT